MDIFSPFNTDLDLTGLRGVQAGVVHEVISDLDRPNQPLAPADRATAQAAAIALYRAAGLPDPQVVWTESPNSDFQPPRGWSNLREPAFQAAKHPDRETGEWMLPALTAAIRSPSSGRFRRAALRRLLPTRRSAGQRTVSPPPQWGRRHRLELWADLRRSCGGWWPFAEVCFLSERPVEADTRHWWHQEGPPPRNSSPLVLRYPDGYRLYRLHDVWMDEEAALDPLLGSPLSEAERATVKTTLDAADPSTFARLLCRDLRGADLRGVRFPKYIPLEGIDLSRVDLRGADLSDASWGCGYGVDCADAVLAGADLRGAELGPECDFTRADLTGANLSGLQLNGSPFTTPRFTGATLVRADLTNTSLVGAKFADVDLRGADLTGARLPPMSPWNRPKADLAFLVENFFPGARWDTSTRWPADLAACAEQLAERSEILPDGTRRVPPMPPRPARTVSMVSTGTMDLPDQQSPWGVW